MWSAKWGLWFHPHNKRSFRPAAAHNIRYTASYCISSLPLLHFIKHHTTTTICEVLYFTARFTFLFLSLVSFHLVSCLSQIAGHFLGTFTKLRKATISFVMSVVLSVHPDVRIKYLGSHWTDFN